MNYSFYPDKIHKMIFLLIDELFFKNLEVSYLLEFQLQRHLLIPNRRAIKTKKVKVLLTFSLDLYSFLIFLKLPLGSFSPELIFT